MCKSKAISDIVINNLLYGGYLCGKRSAAVVGCHHPVPLTVVRKEVENQ